MKIEYTYVWAGWFAVAVLAELTGAGKAVWAALLVVFAVTEGIAVWRVQRGDTLSENAWWWIGENHVGRAAQMAVVAVWLSWHVYLLTPGGVGPALLSLALATWLAPHFYTRGKTG